MRGNAPVKAPLKHGERLCVGQWNKRRLAVEVKANQGFHPSTQVAFTCDTYVEVGERANVNNREIPVDDRDSIGKGVDIRFEPRNERPKFQKQFSPAQ